MEINWPLVLILTGIMFLSMVLVPVLRKLGDKIAMVIVTILGFVLLILGIVLS